MNTLSAAAIRCSLMFLVTASLFSVRPAEAYTVTLQQVGANVVATGSGAINLTGLTSAGLFHGTSGVLATKGFIATGASSGLLDGYAGFTGPTSLGSGGFFAANTSSGDLVGINGSSGGLFVPQGYISGNALSDSMTFNNATLVSLGVRSGTYEWTWGTGLPNQNFTLIIRGAGVPDQGSTFLLLSLGLLGLVAYRLQLLHGQPNSAL